MKNITKHIILVCGLLLTHSITTAQQEQSRADRLKAIEQIELKIAAFTKANLGKEPKFHIHGIHEDHEGHSPEELSEENRAVLAQSYAEYYWRAEYFKRNPKAKNPFQAKMAQNCQGGDFEDGPGVLFDFYSGHYSVWSGGTVEECDAVPGMSWIDASALETNADQFMLVSDTDDDPVAPSDLPTTNDGSGYAVRINSPNPIFVGPTQCSYGSRVNKLTKTIILTEDNPLIAFHFALVFENPAGHTMTQPFFVARAVDDNGVVLDEVCRISDNSADFFESANITSLGSCPVSGALYQPWNCNFLQVSGLVGDEVDLEFITSDCGLGAHFGYAYVDDICGVCTDPLTGLVLLDFDDDCVSGATEICGTFIPPPNESAVNVVLDVIQNGSVVTVGTIPATFDNVNETWCATIDPSVNLPAPGSFDLQVTMEFSSGNFETDIHTNPGPNNDITFDPNIICAPEDLECLAFSGGPYGVALLDWEDNSGGTSYNIEITTYSDDCCSYSGMPSVATTINTPLMPYPLSAAGTYHCATWRVQAIVNGVPGPWSESECLCVEGTCVLEEITTPDCKNTNGVIELNWTGAAGYVGYQVQVTTNSCPGCTSSGFPASYQFNSTNTTLLLPSVQGGYPCAVWKVRGLCSDGTWSNWTTNQCLCTKDKKDCEFNAPTKPSCSVHKPTGIVTLSWDAVVGAQGGYEIVLSVNTKCDGCNSNPPNVSYQPIQVSGTNYNLPLTISNYRCLEWKVRARCDQSTWSPFTTPQCICPKKKSLSDEQNEQSVHLAIPNPTDGMVSFVLALDEEAQYTLELMSTTGSLIRVKQIDQGTNRVDMDLGDLPAGVYLYRTISESNVSEFYKLIIE